MQLFPLNFYKKAKFNGSMGAMNFRLGKEEKETFLKSLGAICEDFMYGVKDFPDYGVPLKDMPKQLKKLLDSYVPF